MLDDEKLMLSIYVHIPFCEKKCPYCDFFSLATARDDVPWKQYATTLVKQIDSDCQKFQLQGREIGSIFFGGGTPSLFPPAFFGEIIESISGKLRLSSDAEITCESNPASAGGDWYSGVRAFGVNRVSVGVQSFNDALLTALGRIHDSKLAMQAVAEAKDAGFKSVSIDLIYSISGESVKYLEDDLRMAMMFQPEHVSAYQLTIEDSTPMYNSVCRGETQLPDDDELLKQMRVVNRMLGRGGWNRYEISNFAKTGFECRHNLNYWHYGEYIGLGAGSVSFLKSFDAKSDIFAQRFRRTRDLKLFSEGDFEPRDVDSLTVSEAMCEFCFMQLRTTNGLLRSSFSREFNKDFDDEYAPAVKELVKQSLAIDDGKSVKLTEKGFEVSNRAFELFVK